MSNHVKTSKLVVEEVGAEESGLGELELSLEQLDTVAGGLAAELCIGYKDKDVKCGLYDK